MRSGTAVAAPLLALSLASACAAKPPPTPITLPAPAPTRPVKLPPHERMTLPNGLRVVVVPDHRLPFATAHLMLRVGSIDDPPRQAGMAELAVALLARGSLAKDADEVAKLVDEAGLRLGAATAYELSHLSCRGRSRYIGRCLALLGELVREPRLAADELASVRRKLVAEARQSRDDGGALAELHFDNLLFGDRHPLGRASSERSLRSIDRAAVTRFVGRHVVPAGAVLAVSGDVTPGDVRALVRRHFAPWPRGALARRPKTRLGPTPPGLRVLLVDKPNLTQSFIAIGHRGLRRMHPLRDAARLLNHVLSGPRLNRALRSRGGKTYNVRSRFDIATDDGSFIVKTYTRNSELGATLALLLRELRRIRREPPTANELRLARGRLAGGYAIRFTTAAKLAAVLGQATLLDLPRRWVTHLGVRLARAPAATVRRAAQLINPDAAVLVVVGPARTAAPQLRRAGLRFSTVSYLAPISSAERARRAAAAAARARARAAVSPAEAKRARALVEAAWRHAGALRLRRVVAVELRARLRIVPAVSFKSPPLVGKMLLRLRRPDQLDVTMALRAVGTPLRARSRQRLRGARGTIEHGGKTRPLGSARLRKLRGALWRQPTLVLDNALAPGVKLRPLPSKRAGRVVVEARPSGGLPAVELVLDANARAPRLLAVRYRDRAGRLRVTTLSRHRRVDGLLVAHRAVTRRGRRVQTVELTSIRFTRSGAARRQTPKRR